MSGLPVSAFVPDAALPPASMQGSVHPGRLGRKTISELTDPELDGLYDQLDLVRGILRSLQLHPANSAERVAKALAVVDGHGDHPAPLAHPSRGRLQDVGGRAASGTSGRGELKPPALSNSPPMEGCPPGRGGRASSGTSGRGELKLPALACMDARLQDVGGRAASGTSHRGGSNSPPLDACMDAGGRAVSGTKAEGRPPGRGGRAASGTKADPYRDVGGRAASGTKAEMYADEELEAWGELYCKLELYVRGAVAFERFMALPVAARRRCCLRAALRSASHAEVSHLSASLKRLRALNHP